MKKITDLKKGDLLTLEAAAEMFKQDGETDKQAKARIRKWREKQPHHPDKYPKSAKIGGTIFFLRSELEDFVNRQFSKAS